MKGCWFGHEVGGQVGGDGQEPVVGLVMVMSVLGVRNCLLEIEGWGWRPCRSWPAPYWSRWRRSRSTGRRCRGGRWMWSGSWWRRWRVSLGLWPGWWSSCWPEWREEGFCGYLFAAIYWILILLAQAACMRCQGTKCPLLTGFLLLFLSFFFWGCYFSPRRSYRRFPQFCVGV